MQPPLDFERAYRLKCLELVKWRVAALFCLTVAVIVVVILITAFRDPTLKPKQAALPIKGMVLAVCISKEELSQIKANGGQLP